MFKRGEIHMLKRVYSEKGLLALRNDLDRNHLSLAILEKEYDLTENQRSYLLHKIDFYDEEEREPYTDEEIEMITRIRTNSNDQMILFQKLEALCPNLRAQLRESNQNLEKIRVSVRRLEKTFNTLGIDYKKEQDISNLVLGLPLKKSDDVVKKYERYKKISKQYEEIKKTHDEKLKQLQAFREEHYEYDLIVNQLVQANIALVNWVIKRYFYGMKLPMEDLQACALEGLSKAILYYDLECKAKFSTFAVEVIKFKIRERFVTLTGSWWDTYNKCAHQREIENQASLRGISIEKIEGYFPYRLTYDEEPYEKEISLEEIFEGDEDDWFNRAEMPLTFDDYEEIDYAEDHFLECAFYRENYEGTSPITLYEKEKLNMEMKKVMDSLEIKDRGLLEYLFGLTSGDSHHIAEAARLYGCSKQNICHWLRRIKRKIKKQDLKDYLYESTRSYQKACSSHYMQAIEKLYYLRKYDFPASTLAFFISTKIVSWTEEEVKEALIAMNIIKNSDFFDTRYLIKEELGDSYPQKFSLIDMFNKIKELEKKEEKNHIKKM